MLAVDRAKGLPASEPEGPHLNRLRFLARACRAKARLDLFRACAMLASDRDVAAQAYADALLRALAQGLGRAPLLHQPGAPERSFDERWLLALLEAAGHEDEASFAFLLRSRLPRHLRRQIGWLAASLAGRMADLDAA